MYSVAAWEVLKDFNNYLGNAYINFGSPIDLGSFLREEVEESDLKKNALSEKPEWLRKATTSLGELIIQGINSSVAVTTTSLFSISLLTDSTQSLSEDKLKQRINLYLDLIKNSKTYNHVWLTNTNASEIINKTEELKLISSQLVGNPLLEVVRGIVFFHFIKIIFRIFLYFIQLYASHSGTLMKFLTMKF